MAAFLVIMTFTAVAFISQKYWVYYADGDGGRAYEQKRKSTSQPVLRYLLLIGLGIVMIYILCWMIGASFKTNSEAVFQCGDHSHGPYSDGYRNGFKGYEGMNLLHFMGNTYKFVLPKVVFTSHPAGHHIPWLCQVPVCGQKSAVYAAALPHCFATGGLRKCTSVHPV